MDSEKVRSRKMNFAVGVMVFIGALFLVIIFAMGMEFGQRMARTPEPPCKAELSEGEAV